MEEFEIKFLEVDVPKLEKKLINIGAKKVGEYYYSRVVLDYPDLRLRDNHSWIRLRTDGKKSTLTYKKSIQETLKDGSIKDIGMKEIEIEVDDYQKTYEILKAVGFITRMEEKNKRIRYKKDETIFDIDFWPFIPAYLEIESTSFEKVNQVAIELGFDPKNGILGSEGNIYKKYGFNPDAYSYIGFDKMVKK